MGKEMKVLWTKLKAALGRGEPIRDREALKGFIDAQAAFIAQKCVTEFCRVRAGVQWTKLFGEEQFQTALERSRWKSFAATLAQVSEMVEGAMRRATGEQGLSSAIEGVARDIIEAHARHSGAPRDFAARAVTLVALGLERAEARSEPQAVRHIPEATFDEVFDSLPLVEIARGQDEDYVLNNLRMNLVAAHEEFLRRAAMGEIAKALRLVRDYGQRSGDNL
jgi:hypothetical protein